MNLALLVSPYYFWSVMVGSPTSASTGSSSRTPSPFGAASAFSVPESYSRKVFVGGLPPDIDEGTSSLTCHDRATRKMF